MTAEMSTGFLNNWNSIRDHREKIYISYDTTNREPLFYEEYSGSVNDMSQLEFMLDKAAGYGYSFIIMVKGMNSIVNSLILERKGTFENKWAQHIYNY